MNDQIDPQAAKVLELAIGAAGHVDGDARAWRNRVVDNVPLIAAMLRAGNVPGPLELADWTLNASVFTGTYRGYELEPTSKRLVVFIETPDNTFKDDDGKDRPLRTEPMWSDLGRSAKRTLDTLRDGDQVLVYRHMAKIEGGAKSARVLAHIVLVSRPRQQPTEPSSQRQPSAPPPPRQDAPAPAPPPPDPTPERPAPRPPANPPTDEFAPASDTAEAQAVYNLVCDLSRSQRLAVGAMCRGNGITNWLDPEPGEVDRVITTIENYRKMKEQSR